MREIEKLDAGLEYNFFNEEVVKRKKKATILCEEYNSIAPDNFDLMTIKIKEILGSAGDEVYINQKFICDNGKNIHIGNDFLSNFNLTILDIAPVHIGNHVMIGPNVLITTVGHPLSPLKRRQHLAQAKPVNIGNDVWIGGNVVILPGITIGNNVVIGAGAIVTHNVPDNCVFAGVPARKIKDLKNDL